MSETINQLKMHKNNLRGYMHWLWKEARPFAPSLFLMTCLMGISSLSVIVTAVLSQKVIDAAGIGASFFMAAVAYVIVLFAAQLAQMIQNMMSITVSEKYGFGIRKNIYDKILGSKWGEIEKYHTGDLNTRLTSDAGNIASGVVDIIPKLSVLVFEMITTFLTLFFYSRGLAVFSLFFAPVAVLLSFLIGRKIKEVQTRLQQSESVYRSFLQESISNLTIIKAFCAEDRASSTLTALRKERFFWVYKKGKLSMISSTCLDLTFQIGYVVAFFWGAYCISNKTLTFGGMTVFLTLVNRIQGPLMEMTSYIPKFVTIFASAERIMELESLENEDNQNVDLQGELGLSLQNISFSYENKQIFSNASVDIRPGECVSLMGESGIGKTTLIRLIMSFIEPDEGQLSIRQADSAVALSPSTRKYISYVPQGNTIISGRISEVLQLAKPDATEEEMIAVLKQAQIYDTIAALPQGIYSMIGERGSGLSEGQIQRIAIARALIRRSPILILDEATSGLDEKTELRILDHVKNLDYRPCCIIISHRRSVLDFCDKWLYIENCKICAEQH